MILIGAIAIGALAAFALLSYVRGVEKDATPNPVTVYVVTAPIKRGTAYADAASSIKRKTIPAEFRPDSFVADPKELENKIAITDLAANQVLVKGMFVGADVATTSFRQQLNPGMVAIALPIDKVKAVGGLLQAGDEVNILVTVGTPTNPAPPPGNNPAVALQATPYVKSARYFYEKVRVLSVDGQVRSVTAETNKDGTAKTAASGAGGAIVFEVPPEVAQRLAAVDPEALYLTLVPENFKPQAIGSIQPGELTGLLPGEDPARITPYGPNGFTPTVSGAGKGN